MHDGFVKFCQRPNKLRAVPPMIGPAVGVKRKKIFLVTDSIEIEFDAVSEKSLPHKTMVMFPTELWGE